MAMHRCRNRWAVASQFSLPAGQAAADRVPRRMPSAPARALWAGAVSFDGGGDGGAFGEEHPLVGGAPQWPRRPSAFGTKATASISIDAAVKMRPATATAVLVGRVTPKTSRLTSL